MSTEFDVVVIGAGPAGYHAAIRAAQLGLKTACIDAALGKDGQPALGGTCLRVGCIPSKALLDSSRQFWNMQHLFGEHGISADNAKIDVGTMVGRKDKIVKQFTGGITALFKANKISPYYGFGQLQPGKRVSVKQHDGSVVELTGKHIVIAAGSDSIELPFAKFDGKHIVDSWGALEFDAVPKRLGVIGAGVIGLELGSVWRRLGAEVVVLEAMPGFLAIADQQLSKEAMKHFKKQGLDIRLGAKVTGAAVKSGAVDVTYTDSSDATQSLTVDKLIVCIGRRPYTDNLLAEGTGVKLDARGFIEVDEHCHTGVENVWAVGDCVRGPMLAHKGKEEGVAVADRIAGLYSHVNYDAVPSVIYTAPEIAWVGQTEEQVKASGRPYKVGSFPFLASGRARAMEASQGFAKVVVASDDDQILGVHIIGPMAGELIAEAVLAMEYSASAEDLQRTIHAHPTLSEALHEAALAADKRAIDMPNR